MPWEDLLSGISLLGFHLRREDKAYFRIIGGSRDDRAGMSTLFSFFEPYVAVMEGKHALRSSPKLPTFTSHLGFRDSWTAVVK